MIPVISTVLHVNHVNAGLDFMSESQTELESPLLSNVEEGGGNRDVWKGSAGAQRWLYTRFKWK